MVSPRLKRIVAELRRRRVGRVAVAYAVTAWLLVEIADTIFPRLLLPEWTITALIVVALVGFPVAIALAWSFDVVPDPASASTVMRAKRWIGVVVAIAFLAVAASVSSRFVPVSSKGEINSLVVLPFENASGNTDEEYFVAGMYDALVGELSQISALRVISRRSAMRYSGSKKPISEIAKELAVNGVIDGSVTRTTNGVQIRVALIKPLPKERQLWSRSFTSDLRGVRTLHADVARSIAQQIRVEITPDQKARLSAARKVDPATYEAYLRGMFHLNKSPEEGVEPGLQYLRQAVELSPNDADAWAGLALGYVTVAHGFAPPPGLLERAREATMRAIELDPMLPEAHAALADLKLYFEWDLEGAEKAFRRANELNPNMAMNHYHHAWFHALMGRLDEAIVEHKIAQQLDPFTPLHTAWLGQLYIAAGRLDDAVAEAKKALEIRANAPAGMRVLGDAYLAKANHARRVLADTQLAKVMYDSAVATHERLAGVTPAGRGKLGHTYAAGGRVDEARKILAQLEAKPNAWNALGAAGIRAALGDYDGAFEWLAYKPSHAWLPWVSKHRWLVPYRDDPRYQAIFGPMRLPPHPPELAKGVE